MKDEFKRLYEAGQTQILGLDLAADLETPISAGLKLGIGRQPYGFLLESAEDGERRGRYSVIGLAPDLIWRVRDGRVEINERALIDLSTFTIDPQPPLDSLRDLIARTKFDLPPDLPAVSAGLFGYMGYDMAQHAEQLPKPPPDQLHLPDSIFIRPSRIVLFDNLKDQITLLALVRAQERVAAHDAYQQGQLALEDMKQALSRALIYPSASANNIEVKPVSNTEKPRFINMVRRVIDYINAGDVYQATISQRFETPFPLPSFALYRALRRVNPSPYLFFMNFENFDVVGSSPEILVRCEDGQITIRPIAGTAPKTGDPQKDEQASQDLLADPKERAEHLMLLDLARNDVGRAAEIGTVKVTEEFSLQWTSHLIHIVSNVDGRLRKDHDALDALMAGFPAGTVAGAPKIRAMEIIAELEKEKRSVYAGALGYFSANGNMDSCITLRTAVVKDGTLYVQAGGGIVADSVPEREYQESVNKAKALHRAAELAHQFAPLPEAVR